MSFTSRAVEFLLFPFVALLVLCIYPGLPPPLSGKEQPAIKSPVALEGPLGINQKLDDPRILFKGQLSGPESFASKDGRIYVGVVGGDLVSFNPDDTGAGVRFETRIGPPCPPLRHAYQENECGRILGIEFDASGDLVIADAYYGLYKWSPGADETPKALVPASRLIDGRPNLITNSLTISSKPEGFIYFTTSSTWISLNSSMLEVLAVPSTGRVMKFDPRDGSVETLVDEVPFANGIQLSVDESFLIFASCGHHRVFKHHLEGVKAGTTEVFFDPPGVPDNISPSPDGGFYIGVVSVEKDKQTKFFTISSPLKLLRENAWLRTAAGNLIMNLINVVDFIDRLYPSPILKTIKFLVGNTETGTLLAPAHALVVRLDASGDVVEALHGTNGQLDKVCEGFAHGKWLYLGSPYAKMDFIARVPLH